MLLLSALLASAVFLTIVNAMAYSGRPGWATSFSIFVLVVAVFGGGYLPLIVHAFFLCLTGLVLAAMSATPRTFLKGSVMATALAYVALGLIARNQIADYDQVRDENPFESLASRLGPETRERALPWGPLGSSEPALKRLAEVEQEVEGKTRLRAQSLDLMHAGYVRRFVESPGFGPLRMLHRPGPLHVRLLDEGPRTHGALGSVYLGSPHAGPEYTPPGTALNPRAANENDGEHLWRMHRIGLIAFLNPEGFGLIRDRAHVAGFVAHGFRGTPSFPQGDGSSLWQVERLELVSLLKQQTPAVYVSEYLPRMEELRHARTRPLDDFEKTALAALRKGEDLRVAATTDRMRVLGSLRAAKQCLSCHDAERGDLLGAFSYKLRREK